MEVSTGDTYTIRPAGRHILTIGRDLIQDSYAAVIELVKNAYDADSPDVEIAFCASTESERISISITDHGHGMSRDTVIDKWMVPSTPDKFERNKSPGGRIMQGKKGIGRYAASILGSDLLLETVTETGDKTTVCVQWADFENARYLADVEVLIETERDPQLSPGTRLLITGDRKFLEEWDSQQFKKLQFELKKLKSPVSEILEDGQNDDDFTITLKVSGFPEMEDVEETIDPYPILGFFDYRITGTITAEGTGILKYTLQKVRNAIEEDIPFDANGPTGCGELVLDIRVYDREKDAILSLIKRGLKDKSGSYLGSQQTRRLLNDYNGIGVYRNGFRIRPLGDPEFDWLKLNEQRIQNPSMRIGSNQAIGYVQIQSEGQSGLAEKSARDGLRENSAFARLKEITKQVIGELETRRFRYRSEAGLSRRGQNTERNLQRLISYDDLKRNIRTQLEQYGTDESTTVRIIELVDQEEGNKNKVIDDIRQAVAIYQGQATLGKIINVILHEGRRPLNYIKNQIRNLSHWNGTFTKTRDPELSQKILTISSGIGENAQVFVRLFGRLDPLAAGRRSPRKSIELKTAIAETLKVFEEEMKSHGIVAEKVVGPDGFLYTCWSQDIYAIFTNLIDNSVYWIGEKGGNDRRISIEVVAEDTSLSHIDYRDTGPGIEPDLIDSEVIFEPQFSTKPDGTGLGLAIAGEAAERNGLELRAIECDHGALFRLQPKTGNGDE